jgi:hypothetical protein
VFGLPAAIEARINAKLAPAAEVAMPDPCDHAVETSAEFLIAHDDDGVLSLRITSGIADFQAAHPSSDGFTVTVFLDTGVDVKLLGDVLNPKGEGELSAAIAPVVEAVARRDSWDADTKAIVRDALAASTSFVLDKRGVRVYADSLPHVIASLADDDFVVPYAKLPRPSGRLAALWGR